jgi:hypothetical protein
LIGWVEGDATFKMAEQEGLLSSKTGLVKEERMIERSRVIERARQICAEKETKKDK